MISITYKDANHNGGREGGGDGRTVGLAQIKESTELASCTHHFFCKESLKKCFRNIKKEIAFLKLTSKEI